MNTIERKKQLDNIIGDYILCNGARSKDLTNGKEYLFLGYRNATTFFVRNDRGKKNPYASTNFEFQHLLKDNTHE